MRYAEYLERLKQAAHGFEVTEYAVVEENGQPYPLVRLTHPGKGLCLITAGFHGEEPAGPLSVLSGLGEVLAHAQAQNVGLVIYPCVNPSGFEAGHRYNESGEHPNNDFIRYEVTPGHVVEEVEVGQAIHRWFLYEGGPKETRALRADIAAGPTPAAALDLHQDAWIGMPCHYAYYFGERAPYVRLLERGDSLVQVGRHVTVHDEHVTDADGLLVHHDGSITDYFFRRGTPFTAVLETSTATPQEKAIAVNVLWMKGFIDFAAAVG
ncbi:MAG: succinylglutamate desuccinylase/aspartoacylase family protein [Myxococcaceae bacterium]|nr:succinylglutamate desuccinylase/aspartoacylase family protein [Myxococcaceae bacterium]